MMKGEISRQVLEKLREGTPMTVREISEALDMSQIDVRNAVRRLHGQNKVKIMKRDSHKRCIWAIN